MTKLLEIFGRAITVKTSDVIWHWLNTIWQSRPVEDQELFGRILTLLSEMKNHIAAEKINEYLANFPDSVYARMAAAVICLRRNQYENALEQLQSVYYREPFNTMALYAIGFCYELLGKEQFAIEFYQDCLKFKHYLQLPRQRLACIDFKNGKIDSAISHFEHLKREYPDDINSLLTLGYLHIANNNIAEAVDVFNTAIAIHPDNFHSQVDPKQIKNMIADGTINTQIEKINFQLEQLGPQPDLFVQLGDIYAAQKDYVQAVCFYQKACRQFPAYLDAVIKMGSIFLAQGQKALAVEEFNKATEINDEIIDAYIGLSTAYALLDETKDAADSLGLAAALQQNSSLLFAETATLKYEMVIGNDSPKDKNIYFSRIIEAHHQLAASQDGLIDAHYKLGLLFFAAGDYSRALDSFRKVLEINPLHHRSAGKAAICMYETGEQAKALELLTANRFEINSDEIELYYKTSLLFYNKCRFDSAMNNIGFADEEQILDAHYEKLTSLLDNMGLIDRAKVNLERLSMTYRFAHQLVDRK